MRDSLETRKIGMKGWVERAGGEEAFGQSFESLRGEKREKRLLADLRSSPDLSEEFLPSNFFSPLLPSSSLV